MKPLTYKLPLFSNTSSIITKPDNCIESLRIQNYWYKTDNINNWDFVCKTCGKHVSFPVKNTAPSTTSYLVEEITRLHPEHPAISKR